MHLRNTLAKGMDAESYSLHTFEALLSQSMENLGELWLLSRIGYILVQLLKFFVRELLQVSVTFVLVVVVAERFVLLLFAILRIRFQFQFRFRFA